MSGSYLGDKPVFPVSGVNVGITLREFYAGQALGGLLAANTQHRVAGEMKAQGISVDAAMVDSAVAQACLKYADAVLKVLGEDKKP